MKMLLSTTAMVVALGLPTLALAQATQPAQAEAKTEAAEPETMQDGKAMPGFLAVRGQSDLFASDLIGHDVHAHRTADASDATATQDAANADGTHDMATMTAAELDGMDNIGQINEIVLSSDGQVRALVIGVGGFLGMGEHDVAVTMDQVSFASDADDPSQMYIVVNSGAHMLKTAPAYDRTSALNDEAPGDDGTAVAERTAFAAPAMERDGYVPVEVRDVSAEMLLGKTVYDLEDNNVGEVKDLILDESGKITNVIIDFGGFLGIGTSQASLQYEELTILSNDGYADVRLYVDATKEQIQELPRYMASN